MRPNRKVTAVLLSGALAAVGCSKPSETSEIKNQESPYSAQAKLVSVTKESSVPKPVDGGLSGIGTTKIAGPMSFTDGEAAYQAKNYVEAIRIFEQYTVERPKNAWGHYMLGLSSSKGGEPAKAEVAFGQALSIDPNHFKSLVNLSRVLIDQKRHDEAIEKLTRAGEIDPMSTDVPRLMGRTYHAQGKIDEAVASYRQAIALDEKDVWSMNNLGLLLIEQKRSDEAVPLLAKAVELKKDEPVFHNNLGMALEHTKRFGAAATAYNGALQADPGYGKAQQNLTRVEAVKGGREEPFDTDVKSQVSVEEKQITPSDATVAAR